MAMFERRQAGGDDVTKPAGAPSHEGSSGLAALLWLSLASGLVLLLGGLAAVPITLLGAAGALFVLCVLSVFLVAARQGRGRGIGTGRALLDGLIAAGRWVVAFLPP